MMDRETSSHRHSHLIIILFSVVIGMLAVTVACNLPREKGVTSLALAQDLPDLEEGFVSVAETTLPAVVSIKVESEGRVPVGRELPEEIEKFFRENPFFRWWSPESPDEEEDEDRIRRQQLPFRPQGMGSGWIYSDDGYIVTNSHVVAGASKVTVTLYDKENDDKGYPATVVGSDPATELAVIKVDAGRKLPTLKLGDSDRVRVGSWVMAVGAPYQLEQTVTVGVVSAKGRSLATTRYRPLGEVIQTDAAINPGNSGGPLVNLKGEVVGINVAYAAPSALSGNAGIGFAIPANIAKRVVADLVEHKKVARGWLGVQIKDLTGNLKKSYGVKDDGVLVLSVEEDGPASKSELQAEDVIVAVDGKKTPDTWSLQRTIGEVAPDSTVKLTVIRDGKEKEIAVKLGELPDKYAGREAPAEETAPAQEAALGLTVTDITKSMAEKNRLSRDSGVVVREVSDGSPALGEIQPGDVILKVNRQEIKSVADYKRAIEQAKKDKAEFIVFQVERRVDEDVIVDIVDVETNW